MRCFKPTSQRTCSWEKHRLTADEMTIHRCIELCRDEYIWKLGIFQSKRDNATSHSRKSTIKRGASSMAARGYCVVRAYGNTPQKKRDWLMSLGQFVLRNAPLMRWHSRFCFGWCALGLHWIGHVQYIIIIPNKDTGQSWSFVFAVLLERTLQFQPFDVTWHWQTTVIFSIEAYLRFLGIYTMSVLCG